MGIDHSSLCSHERRLAAPMIETMLYCQIHAGGVEDGIGAIASALGTAAFSRQISSNTRALLGDDSEAFSGELSLTRAAAWSVEGTHSGGESKELRPSWAVLYLA